MGSASLVMTAWSPHQHEGWPIRAGERGRLREQDPRGEQSPEGDAVEGVLGGPHAEALTEGGLQFFSDEFGECGGAATLAVVLLRRHRREVPGPSLAYVGVVLGPR